MLRVKDLQKSKARKNKKRKKKKKGRRSGENGGYSSDSTVDEGEGDEEETSESVVDEFKAKRPSTCKTIKSAAPFPFSKWTWLTNKERVIETASKRNKSGNLSELVIFVTKKEQTAKDTYELYSMH